MLTICMSLEEKKIEDKTVDRLMDKFTSNLDADDIMDKCLSKGLITENDLSRIGATLKHGRTAQAVRDLMLSVKRSAPGYLKTLCGILNDSKSSFLVPYIEEEYRVQSEAKIPPITNKYYDLLAGLKEKLEAEAEEATLLNSNFNVALKLNDDIGFNFFPVAHRRQGVMFPLALAQTNSKPTIKAVSNMLLEVGDVLGDASVEASVEKCKKLYINSDNVHSQFTETIRTVIDTGPYPELTWKEIVMCFSSVAGFGIHLCTNNMSDLAAQVYYDWMPQIMQYILQPWIDDQGGWVSTIKLLG